MVSAYRQADHTPVCNLCGIKIKYEKNLTCVSEHSTYVIPNANCSETNPWNTKSATTMNMI